MVSALKYLDHEVEIGDLSDVLKTCQTKDKIDGDSGGIIGGVPSDITAHESREMNARTATTANVVRCAS